MPTRSAYPWFFFLRVAKLSFLVFLPTLILVLFLYRSSYKQGLVQQVAVMVEGNLRSALAAGGTPEGLGRWCRARGPGAASHFVLLGPGGPRECGPQGPRLAEAPVDLAPAAGAFAHQVRPSRRYDTETFYGAVRGPGGATLVEAVPLVSLRNDLNRFDRVLFLRIVPFALGSFLLFLLLFYRATRPLGNVLTKVERFKENLPFDETLRLFYDKNEWAGVEGALRSAEDRLNLEIKKVKTENEKIAAILESIYDDIIAVDPFETILFYNSNFRANFVGEGPAAELVPKLWHLLKDDQVLRAFRGVLRTGERTSLKGLSFLSSRRPDRFFDLTITPLRGADGLVSGALGVFYDITDFKLAEQMRVDFVANVSHEIRTPLTSIKGFSQVLEQQREKIDPALHGFLGKIVANTERMIHLFNDLLSLSVIESQDHLEREEIALRDLVETVTENIKTNYPGKRAEVRLDLRLETLVGNRRLVEQVLSNLVDNAFKYSGDRLVLAISAEGAPGLARLTLRDDGPGIPKEHLQRIFERFYRVDSSRETSRGTGLGLAIVKHIISKHGGRIWAQSEAGAGATFVVELPA